MQIIGGILVWTDNFDRETMSERVVADNIASEKEADIMLTALRDTCNEHQDNWYKLEDDKYILRTFEP